MGRVGASRSGRRANVHTPIGKRNHSRRADSCLIEKEERVRNDQVDWEYLLWLDSGDPLWNEIQNDLSTTRSLKSTATIKKAAPRLAEEEEENVWCMLYHLVNTMDAVHDAYDQGREMGRMETVEFACPFEWSVADVAEMEQIIEEM